MNTTTNYGLKKPESTDFYDIDDFNYNSDKIDAELVKKLEAADLTVTLTVLGWEDNEQTVSVTGLTSTSRFMAGPDIDSFEEARSVGLRPTAYGSGTITFKCDELPENAIDINITFLK